MPALRQNLCSVLFEYAYLHIYIKWYKETVNGYWWYFDFSIVFELNFTQINQLRNI